MSITKTAAVAILVAATGLGATMSAAAAHGKKYKKHYGHHHHHHHHKGRNFAYGVVVGAAMVGALNYDYCKKWKDRYKRTGNPVFLDRYYACKY